ncbi:type II toxin-antitoxin system HicB family antitoxin [Candidatus Peregrinibacteria bacterium]|nr:type II toxin-antitoxin system HicB family antitoxin [Candidatus Peregrinibacteria bacterium]
MSKIGLKNAVWKEGRYYVSWNINTGISSFGDTKKEALESLREALGLYLEDIPLSKVNKVERLDIIPLVFKHA